MTEHTTERTASTPTAPAVGGASQRTCSSAADSPRPETSGLTLLGRASPRCYDNPDAAILEAFPNRYPDRDYVIRFEHPEFTSLCPMTGQPDFGNIILRYVPHERCVESKSFKLYMAAFRNHGSFMESLTNKIADDLVGLLAPRRLTVEGIFNVRGGTGISVRVEYLMPGLEKDRRDSLSRLWQA